MANKVFYGDDARSKILSGAEALYKAVRTTLGPRGCNVVIGRNFGPPSVTHDGVTVAKAIELSDDDLGHRTGAELIKQAANKMNDVAGDGTTTVTILTYHILKEANRLIAAGHDPMQLRKGLEKAGKEAITRLNRLSEDIKTDAKRVAEVATISAGDAEIGKLIASVMSKVGKDGVVTVEEGQGLKLESEVVEGFTFDKGLISPYFATDTTRMEAVYEKPAVLIIDKKLSSMQELLPMLERLTQANRRQLLIIAEDVEGDALPNLVVNKMKGALGVVAVKAPSFGDRRKEILEDIATLTGATVISEDKGYTLDNTDLSVIGSARKVIVRKDDTTIIEGSGDITERLKELEVQIKKAPSKYEKENLEKRRAALSGKVAVIKVGGATETEIEEKKYRVDDAVAAVKAALDEGIVPGGGVTYLNLASTCEDDLLKNALEKPFKILLTNAGLKPDVWQIDNFETGIDVKSGELVNLKKAGIIDPTKVAKEAIQNAVSIAGTAITMGALVVELPKKEEENEN